MTTRSVARCGIYEDRPEMCRDYPRIDHWMPSECGFHFAGTERGGACDCGIAACCMAARQNGEPGGAPIPETAGGLSCKHVVWVDEPAEQEKVASVNPYNAERMLMDAVSGD